LGGLAASEIADEQTGFVVGRADAADASVNAEVQGDGLALAIAIVSSSALLH